jgi:replicative DNA helicase
MCPSATIQRTFGLTQAPFCENYICPYAEQPLNFKESKQMQEDDDWTANIKSLVWNKIAEIRRRSESELSREGLQTGFEDLNCLTQGLIRGTLTVVGGRPSMGKTSFALNLVRNISTELNHPTVFVSPRDSKEQLVERLLSIASEVDCTHLRVGVISASDQQRLELAAEQLQDSPLKIIDNVDSIDGIFNHCKQLERLGVNLELLVIDDIQSLRGVPAEFTDTDPADRVFVSLRLKKMAKDLNIAVVACSQLSQAPETRRDPRPALSDLPTEVADGVFADLVLLLYRDEYYFPETDERGQAEIIIAKQNHGPMGTIDLLYNRNNCRFNDKFNGCLVDEFDDSVPTSP